MILNFDRRRLYIFGSIAVLLILFLGFYHAPTYGPAEFSRMKTSVSTWLKGTEPSLSDEFYKDTPHFNTGADAATEEEPAAEIPYEHHSQLESIDYTDTFPDSAVEPLPAAPVDDDDEVNVLPPPPLSTHSTQSVSSVALAAVSSETVKQLPSANDFVDVLPPVNVLSNAAEATDAYFAMSLPQPTDIPIPTTLATHTRPVLSSSTEELGPAYGEEEDWWLEDSGEKR